jgi:hypothetical protein
MVAKRVGLLRERLLQIGFVWTVGWSMVATAGCNSREPQTFALRVISIDTHGGPALPEDRVRAIVRRSLEHSPSFVPAERDQRSGTTHGDTLVATFEYRELPDASDHGRDLMVRLLVEVPESLAAELGPDGLDVTVLLERAAGEADLAYDLQLATDRVTTILQARTDLARGTEGTVARLLDTGDPDRVILALEWILRHPEHAQARAASSQVAGLLEHPDDRIALLAIDCIGEVGGPEHVAALLARIPVADTAQVNRAYDALARLGGPEAEGFLKFAARNEDEPVRRAAAERALQSVAESAMVDPRRGRGVPNRGHR